MRSVFRSIGFGRQKASVESLNHIADDPTTRTASISGAHHSVTKKPEKDLVVQQGPSKNAFNLSPTAKAALNAFQCTLDALGKTPIPGIGAVTAVLLQVVKGVQEIPQVEAGWKELADRMARLLFLMRKISAAPEFQNEMEQYCTPLNDELGKLSDDIDEASKRGRLVNFFTSTDGLASLSTHQKKLDSIINDLTAALCMNTALTKAELRTHLDEIVSRLHEEILSSASLASDGPAIHMTGNTIDEIIGPVVTNNKLSGNARITMSSNKFGKVHGAVLSHNTVGP